MLPQRQAHPAIPNDRSRQLTMAGWFMTIVLLIAGTTMPGAVKSEIQAQLWSGWPWSATAHFVLFAAIVAFPVYGQDRWWVWRALAVAVLLAVLTECLQSLVPGRYMRLRDGLIDLAGAASGMLATVWWSKKRARETRRQ
jgi:VanZ family protein